MMFRGSAFAATMALAATLSAPVSQAAEPAAPKEPSFYIQCDGNPNNMAAGETIARFIGAVTLLALFAPSPETPDPSKRKFGAAGVDACSQLIDSATPEGNIVRRLPLILARALHRIEAKDYVGAIGDTELARREAVTAGLAENPYFKRSMGMSIDLIAGIAALRQSDMAQAIQFNYAPAQQLPNSYYPLLVPRNYVSFSPQAQADEIRTSALIARMSPPQMWRLANAYAENGRYADAAIALRQVNDWRRSLVEKPEEVDVGFTLASIALYQALAGDWTTADASAKEARQQVDQRKLEGRQVDSEAAFVELLDLFDLLKKAHAGQMDEARRLFAGRSRWVGASFGQLAPIIRQLREGARPDQLVGPLALSPEDAWQKRRDEQLATLIQSDTDNKTLFKLLLPYASVSDYESMSGKVWNLNGKSLLNPKPVDKTGYQAVNALMAGPMTQPDVMLLHCALKAKALGKNGMLFFVHFNNPSHGFVRFGNRGEEGMVDALFIDADAVIAELAPIIPSPTDLAGRRAARAKTAS